MNLCNHDHQEVCFEGHDCPMCEMREEMLEQLGERDTEIGGLQKQVSDLEQQIENLQDEAKG